jgi:uncharacterized protein (TIGR02466 family)
MLKRESVSPTGQWATPPPQQPIGQLKLLFPSFVFQASLANFAARESIVGGDTEALAPMSSPSLLQTFNSAIYNVVMAMHTKLTDEFGPYLNQGHRGMASPASFSNDVFFQWQNEAGGWAGMMRRSRELRQLMDRIASAIEEYIARKGFELPPRPIQGSDLNAWAGVHYGGAQHGQHIHAASTVSGTYYVNAPVGVGALKLSDPKGSTAHVQDLSVTPRAGDLILFPSWLVHQVTATELTSDSTPRVAISFNWKGRWHNSLRDEFATGTAASDDAGGSGDDGGDRDTEHCGIAHNAMVVDFNSTIGIPSIGMLIEEEFIVADSMHAS